MSRQINFTCEGNFINKIKIRRDPIIDNLSLEDYMRINYRDEIDNLQRIRNERFSLRRENKIKLELSNQMSWDDANILKEILENQEDKEELRRKLIQIRILNQNKLNLELMTDHQFPLIISEIFYRLKEINELMSECVQTLNSFCNVDYADFYMFKPAINKICKLLKNLNLPNESFLVDLLKILSFCCDCFTKKSIRIILKEELIHILIYLLKCENVDNQIKIYSLRILGNICTSTNERTQSVIDAGLVKLLKTLLTDSSPRVRKDAGWIVSNISVGTADQIESLLEEDIFPILKNIILTDYPSIRKEAIWATCNLCNVTSKFYIETLVDQGIIDILLELLTSKETRFIILSIEALFNMVYNDNINIRNRRNNDFYSSKSLLRTILIPRGLLDILDNLNYHKEKDISDRVLKFMEEFIYNVNEEDFNYYY